MMLEQITFVRTNVPEWSVVRHTSTKLAGGVASPNAFINSGLFRGQPAAHSDLILEIATAADAATREV